jgi:hypothetical protein
MLIKREDVRAFPTDMVFAEKPEEIDFDFFQLTILPVTSPVAILHHSHDGQWAYVQSRICKGWLKSESIALVKDKKEMFDYINSENFLIITESRVETEPNPFVSEISNILFQMGDRIALIDFDAIPKSIPLHCRHAQSPQGCYVVKIPVKDKNGYLRFEPALIARSNDVSEGYLAYTRENILRLAFKLLGERYGWNGMFIRRDCAQFIMNVYRTMNIQLPVFTWIQEKGAAGMILKFPGPIEQREQLLNQLQAGDSIHLKGHVMMYLGNTGKNHYIIHSAGGYGIKDENDRLKPVTIHGIFVSEVHQWMMNQRKTYLEAFTTALKYQ